MEQNNNVKGLRLVANIQLIISLIAELIMIIGFISMLNKGAEQIEYNTIMILIIVTPISSFTIYYLLNVIADIYDNKAHPTFGVMDFLSQRQIVTKNYISAKLFI